MEDNNLFAMCDKCNGLAALCGKLVDGVFNCTAVRHAETTSTRWELRICKECGHESLIDLDDEE